MKVIQCDVCGRRIDKNKPNAGSLKVKMKRQYMAEFPYAAFERLDICPECSDKMMTWIRKEAKNE